VPVGRLHTPDRPMSSQIWPGGHIELAAHSSPSAGISVGDAAVHEPQSPPMGQLPAGRALQKCPATHSDDFVQTLLAGVLPPGLGVQKPAQLQCKPAPHSPSNKHLPLARVLAPATHVPFEQVKPSRHLALAEQVSPTPPPAKRVAVVEPPSTIGVSASARSKYSSHPVNANTDRAVHDSAANEPRRRSQDHWFGARWAELAELAAEVRDIISPNLARPLGCAFLRSI